MCKNQRRELQGKEFRKFDPGRDVARGVLALASRIARTVDKTRGLA